MTNLETMKAVDLMTVSPAELVDINEVTVDKSLSKNDRIAEFVKQIKNPYCFKCGDFIVKARYSDSGLTIEDCLEGLL